MTTSDKTPSRVSNNRKRLQRNYAELEKEADSHQLNLDNAVVAAAQPLFELPETMKILHAENREHDIPKVKSLISGINSDLQKYGPKVTELKDRLDKAKSDPDNKPGDLRRKYSTVLNVSAQMLSLSGEISNTVGRSANQITEILHPTDE